MHQPKLYLEKDIVRYMCFSMCSERSIYDTAPSHNPNGYEQKR